MSKRQDTKAPPGTRDRAGGNAGRPGSSSSLNRPSSIDRPEPEIAKTKSAAGAGRAASRRRTDSRRPAPKDKERHLGSRKCRSDRTPKLPLARAIAPEAKRVDPVARHRSTARAPSIAPNRKSLKRNRRPVPVEQHRAAEQIPGDQRPRIKSVISAAGNVEATGHQSSPWHARSRRRQSGSTR